MNSRMNDPLDPAIEAWIDEQNEAALTLDPRSSADETGEELKALLREARDASQVEMSAEDARMVLTHVRARVARDGVAEPGRRDALVAMAALLAGVAIGLAGLRSSRSPARSVQVASSRPEVVKRMSFESVHEGKVVRFHLELKRAH